MTEWEVQNVYRYEHSTQRRIFKKGDDRSYLISIYRDDKALVKKNCHYLIVINDLKPQVEHLYENTFLFTNMSEIKYQCVNQETSQKGCESCIMSLKQRCSIQAGEYFLPEAITGKFEENEETKYTTSLPLLLEFFTNETLKDINGFTQYVQPHNIQIPKFEYYETNLTKTFSGDRKRKVNLGRAVQSIKNDEVIVTGLSEAIVLGKVSTNIDFWMTTPGIVTITMTTVGIVTAVSSLYLMNKVRYLLLTVEMLRCNALKVNAKSLELNFQQNKGNDGMNVTAEEEKIHELILQWIKKVQSQHVSSLLALSILLII